jgi:hypothetical protein
VLNNTHCFPHISFYFASWMNAPSGHASNLQL